MLERPQPSRVSRPKAAAFAAYLSCPWRYGKRAKLPVSIKHVEWTWLDAGLSSIWNRRSNAGTQACLGASGTDAQIRARRDLARDTQVY
jgi:hypothetical protein